MGGSSWAGVGCVLLRLWMVDDLGMGVGVMAKDGTEARFLAQVVCLAGQLGYTLAYHTHDSRRSVEGFPDLVLVRPPAGGGGRGRVVFAELKVGRARPTVAQEAWLEGLRLAGQEAYVWWPEQEAEIVEVLRAGC